MGIRIAAGIVTAIVLFAVMKLAGPVWLLILVGALLVFHIATRGRHLDY